MRRFVFFVIAFSFIVALGVLLPHSRLNGRAIAAGQVSGNWHSGDCSDDSHWGHWGQSRVCQMRRTIFALPSGHLSVNTMNGGIDVTGEDRPDVSLEARVRAWALSQSEANDLLNQIAIDTDGGEVRDHGPHPSFFGRTGYSIDYQLHVPRHLTAEFHTMNGGIDLARLDGPIHFATTNGGVSLDHLSGDVQGSTVNGGLNISLSGDHWQGGGLHAQTTNGRIDLTLPDHYSAHLETATVNGGISLNFPITIQGNIRNSLNTDLGSGGPTVHVQTVNGGVTISHGGAETTD